MFCQIPAGRLYVDQVQTIISILLRTQDDGCVNATTRRTNCKRGGRTQEERGGEEKDKEERILLALKGLWELTDTEKIGGRRTTGKRSGRRGKVADDGENWRTTRKVGGRRAKLADNGEN